LEARSRWKRSGRLTQQDCSVVLPATEDVLALCKSFIQKADQFFKHYLGSLG
jgi:hypothetical protein